MLRELHVKNLAVVAEASFELAPGLNALTGETGAGKSIVVDSLALLSGARASADWIRSGAETLTVTGFFEPRGSLWRHVLEEAGLDASDGELLVRREVGRTGRNRVFVNDQATTVRLLADLAPELLRIHGQRDELGLTAPDLQRQWLDHSGGSEAIERGARVAEAFEKWSRLAARLDRLSGDERSRRDRLELLRLQGKELSQAGLEAGEDERLRSERDELRQVESLLAGAGGAYALLAGEEDSASAKIARAHALLDGLEAWATPATTWKAELEEARIRIEEVGRELASRLERLEASPGRLDQVEDRLATLERLARRFGERGAPASLERLLALEGEIAAEIEELGGDALDQSELATQAQAALDAYCQEALALSAARASWATSLAQKVEKELADLGLAKARFAIRLSRRRRADSPLVLAGESIDFSRDGLDQVVFELAANPGEDMGPLAKRASGGELARIYLALQLAAGRGRGEALPTLVFDEVDVGVGGAQAAALGKKLQRLAAQGQILVVTHLPQVASHADRHYRVAKKERAGRTHTQVEPLSDAERTEEIARMLAGSKVTELSRSHARELLTTSAAPLVSDSPAKRPAEVKSLAEVLSDGELARQVAARVADGSILAIPTESSYGLAVDPRSAAGVAAVYGIKLREAGKPLPVVIAHPNQLPALGIESTGPRLEHLAELWPAPLSIVLPTRFDLPASGGSGTLAVRVPAHQGLLALLTALGTPLTATSANLAGEAPLLTAEEVAELLSGTDALVLDGGLLPGGPPSTLIAPSEPPLACRLLRNGAFDPACLVRVGLLHETEMP